MRSPATLRDRRADQGALEFARSELHPVVEGDGVKDLLTETTNRAKTIIENFMVAANGVAVRFLTDRGFATIRRVVKTPERWARIVDLASQHGGSLPAAADARALQEFLRARRIAEPDTFQDLSLAIIKLLGRGEYVAESAAEPSAHFALATGTYSHSTAPNRRFPDVVIQRLLKAAIDKQPAPYQLPELRQIADHCTKQEDAANKVERLTGKAAAALWLTPQIGKTFDSVVTGAGPKGTWVRLVPTPVEGRLARGAEGLDVGDKVRVRLVSTDPRRGFIDFARATDYGARLRPFLQLPQGLVGQRILTWRARLACIEIEVGQFEPAGAERLQRGGVAGPRARQAVEKPLFGFRRRDLEGERTEGPDFRQDRVKRADHPREEARLPVVLSVLLLVGGPRQRQHELRRAPRLASSAESDRASSPRPPWSRWGSSRPLRGGKCRSRDPR